MLDKLILHCGNQARLAKFLGVTRATVTQWKNDGYMTKARAYEIEVKTNGLFKAKDLIKGDDNDWC